MAWSSTIIHTDWTLRQLNPMRHTSILSGGRVQGYEMPSGNAAKRLSRLRGCQSSGPNKNRKKLVSKNISGPGREYALLTRHHWNTSLGRQGVGMSHFQQWSKASATERRSMVQAEVRCTEKNQRKAGTT